MVKKVKCVNCGVEILPSTAQEYGGMCASCARDPEGTKRRRERLQNPELYILYDKEWRGQLKDFHELMDRMDELKSGDLEERKRAAGSWDRQLHWWGLAYNAPRTFHYVASRLLKTLSKDESAEVRSAAILSLRTFVGGMSRSPDPLSSENKRCFLILFSLDAINTILMSLEEDVSESVRYDAAWLLEDFAGSPWFPAKDVIPRLIRILAVEKGEVLQVVVRTLEDITREDLGEDPEKWQRWWEENKDRF